MPIQNRNDLLDTFAKIDKVVNASKAELIKAGTEYPEIQTQEEKNAGLALIARITKQIEACEELAREARAWVELPENNNEADLQTCQQKEKALKLVRAHNLSFFSVKVNTVWVGSAGDRAFLRGEEPAKQNETTSSKASAQKSSTAQQSVRTAEQSELLTKLESSLSKMQEEFPFSMDKKGPKADMGSLIYRLSRDLNGYINKTNHDNPDEKAQYEYFKNVVNFHLNGDTRGKAVRKPNSLLYPVHYAVVALFRAFFRIFDVILSLGSKQTKNDTPGYEPFFKLPEASLSKRAVELSKEFEDAINKLDELKGMKPATGNTPN